MKSIILAWIILVTFAASGVNAEVAKGPAQVGSVKPVVLLETSMGDILIQLDPQKAPLTVANFLNYVRSGFYDGTIFHRVARDFVIQGGGLTPELKPKPTNPPIQNEADNGLKNRRGTIAMARPIDVDSATSQFYFNLTDNRVLDHRDNSIQGYGYTVFGKIINGMEVVDRISLVETGKQKGMKYVPLTPVIIRSVRVLE